jgi:hypothetical protein
MSETTVNDQTAQLATLLAQMKTAATPASAVSSANPWSKPATTAASTEVLGVSIPISVDTPDGKLRVYLNFPGSAASSPEALFSLIEQLASTGMPLDIWQSQSKGSGWGNGNRGGGFGNRGGFNNRNNGR